MNTELLIQRLEDVKEAIARLPDSLHNTGKYVTVCDAITHLTALSERCARLEEDGKRLTDLDDVMIWVSIETGSRNGGLNPKISGNAPIRTLIDRTLAAARTAKEAT